MPEKQKNLKTYKATWDRIKANPQPWLREHVKLVTSDRAESPDAETFVTGTHSCDSLNTLNKAIHAVNVRVAKVALEKFIEVEQRLPRKDEKFTCYVSLRSHYATHKRSGEDSTLAFTLLILPKV